MKNISSPKNIFLLEAPLEILHAESIEWLEEIEFWKDESTFFYALIIGRAKKNPPFLQSKETKIMESHLVYISAEKLDDLKMEVLAHEKFLAWLLDGDRMDEQMFRTKHKAIKEKMHGMEKEFKKMKSAVFSLAEKSHSNK